MIIPRPALAEEIETISKWVLVYGRRKTGKTFLVQNFMSYDEYFFVKRDRTILSEGTESISYETLLTLLTRSKGTIVIDEFHRLPDEFMDRLHALSAGPKLILISSTLHFAKTLLQQNSPLLGLVAEKPVSLLSLSNILPKLETSKKKEKLEQALLLKEPITIDYYDGKISFSKVLTSSLQTIPSFVGEIFVEEDRKFSNRYEGVLRAIATGKTSSGEIADALHSKAILKRNDPSLVQQYLTNLRDFGILNKTKIYTKNRYRYSHVSPLVHIYYYADEKYNISERKPSDKELKRLIDTCIPRIVEAEIRSYLAQKYGLQESLSEHPDYDIDALLLRYQKPEVAVEIKWKNTVSKADVRRAETVLSKVNVKKRMLFVPDKKDVPKTDLTVLDVSDL